jgi:hypothetical protein
MEPTPVKVSGALDRGYSRKYPHMDAECWGSASLNFAYKQERSRVKKQPHYLRILMLDILCKFI